MPTGLQHPTPRETALIMATASITTALSTITVIPPGTEQRLPVTHPCHSWISPGRGGTTLAPSGPVEMLGSPGSGPGRRNNPFGGAGSYPWQSTASGATGCHEAQSRDSQRPLIIPAPPSLKKKKRKDEKALSVNPWRRKRVPRAASPPFLVAFFFFFCKAGRHESRGTKVTAKVS